MVESYDQGSPFRYACHFFVIEEHVMSLTVQTNAVKIAIQNAFESVKNKIDGEVVELESRMIDRTDSVVEAGMNDVVRYNPVIVENAAEVEYQKGQEESFSDVFANWKRISHNDTDTYPASTSELSSWSYDDVNDSISCTVNSSTLVGFIAPEKFEDYSFEVLANSDQTDDDQIGICLAFVTSGGREYTLTALRNPQGNGIGAAERFQIVYNYRQSDARIITQTSSGLSTDSGGWATMATGLKIRAERSGDTFAIKTTDHDGVDFVAAAELTVDLNSDPILSKFKGPMQYGYVAFSQANSTWETLARPIALDEIIDLENGVKWDYDGNDWSSSSIPVDQTSLTPRRFYFNEATQRLYVSDESGSPIRILLPDHGDSDDHDGRYYTRNEIDTLVPNIVDQALSDGHNHPWSQITNPPNTATRWPTWGEVTTKPSEFTPEAHSHDDLYYPKATMDSLLGDKVSKVVGKDLSDVNFTTTLSSKLTGIESGAEVNVDTDLSATMTAAQVTLMSSTGNDAIIPSATSTNAGVMSSSDKSKLDNVTSGAEPNASTTASRSLSDADTVLQAKAFVDHNTSGDHDDRYHTKSALTSLLADKLDAGDVLNVLTSTSVSKALSAAQGKVLRDDVNAINSLLQSDTGTLDTLQEIVDFIQLNRTDLDSLTVTSIAGLQGALNNKVDAVSGKGLSSNDFTNALLGKLNGIDANAEANVSTNLSQSRNATSYTVVSSTGSNTTLSAASASAAGIMSAADKSKLDAVASGANDYTHPGNSFSMTALTGASVVSDISVDSTGHLSSVSTRNISKGDVGLGNVPNTNATNASNLSSGTVPAGRLSGSYGINITGNADTATALATARKINGVSFNGSKNITIADGTKVSKSGDTMTGRLNIGGVDDSINDLQVDGDTSLRGNVGVGIDDPTHAVDVDGNIRLRDNNVIYFGGTGANDAKFEIRYNPTTESLEFNYLG